MLHPTLRPLRPALSFAREWLLLVYVTVRDFSRVASYISRHTLRVVANERDDRVVAGAACSYRRRRRHCREVLRPRGARGHTGRKCLQQRQPAVRYALCPRLACPAPGPSSRVPPPPRQQASTSPWHVSLPHARTLPALLPSLRSVPPTPTPTPPILPSPWTSWTRFGDACRPDMVLGGPHTPDAVRRVVLFLVFMFNPRLPPSLSSVASDCDTDLVQYHTTSELLCVMSVVVDGEVPMEVLQGLERGCA